MLQVVSGNSRRPRRSVANASVLALAMSVLVSFLPSTRAEAADSCASILTDLRTQYLSTTSQLNAAIAAHTDANGKVDIQFITPAFVPYSTQTSAATSRLRTQPTCGVTPVNTNANLLATDIKTAASGASTVLQVVPSSQLNGAVNLTQQLQLQVVSLANIMVTIYAASHIDIKPVMCTLLRSDPNIVQVFSQVGNVFCR